MHTHDPVGGTCPHCQAIGTVTRPSPLWRVAEIAAWFVTATSVFLISLIGPFIVALGPVVLFTSAGTLGFLHDRATAEPECAACGKIARPARPA